MLVLNEERVAFRFNTFLTISFIRHTEVVLWLLQLKKDNASMAKV
jgi:hypothetical protein